MTLAELVEKLQALKHGDPEGGHIEADKLLLEFIGEPDVTEAFDAIGKWYA